VNEGYYVKLTDILTFMREIYDDIIRSDAQAATIKGDQESF